MRTFHSGTDPRRVERKAISHGGTRAGQHGHLAFGVRQRLPQIRCPDETVTEVQVLPARAGRVFNSQQEVGTAVGHGIDQQGGCTGQGDAGGKDAGSGTTAHAHDSDGASCAARPVVTPQHCEQFRCLRGQEKRVLGMAFHGASPIHRPRVQPQEEHAVTAFVGEYGGGGGVDKHG